MMEWFGVYVVFCLVVVVWVCDGFVVGLGFGLVLGGGCLVDLFWVWGVFGGYVDLFCFVWCFVLVSWFGFAVWCFVLVFCLVLIISYLFGGFYYYTRLVGFLGG